MTRDVWQEEPEGNIWRAPSDIVAPYAIGDVDLPLRIFAKQEDRAEEEGAVVGFVS